MNRDRDQVDRVLVGYDREERPVYVTREAWEDGCVDERELEDAVGPKGRVTYGKVPFRRVTRPTS